MWHYNMLRRRKRLPQNRSSGEWGSKWVHCNAWYYFVMFVSPVSNEIFVFESFKRRTDDMNMRWDILYAYNRKCFDNDRGPFWFYCQIQRKFLLRVLVFFFHYSELNKIWNFVHRNAHQMNVDQNEHSVQHWTIFLSIILLNNNRISKHHIVN